MAAVVRVFLENEAKHSGWRFWLLFVIATNLGWFPGILLGIELSDWLWPDEIGPVKSGFAAIPAALGFAPLQAWVLSRHGIPFGRWFSLSALGWGSGIYLADWFLLSQFSQWQGFGRIALLGALAGLWMGLPQAWVLSRAFAKNLWWWFPMSFVGWGVQFPGAIPGAAVMLLLRTSPSERGVS